MALLLIFAVLIGLAAIALAPMKLLRAAVNTRAAIHYGPGREGGWEYCATEWCRHSLWQGRPRHQSISDEQAEQLERKVQRQWRLGTVLCVVNVALAGLLLAAVAIWHREPWMGMGDGAPVGPIVAIVGAFVVWPWATRMVAAGRLANSQPIGSGMIYRDGSSS